MNKFQVYELLKGKGWKWGKTLEISVWTHYNTQLHNDLTNQFQVLLHRRARNNSSFSSPRLELYGTRVLSFLLHGDTKSPTNLGRGRGDMSSFCFRSAIAARNRKTLGYSSCPTILHILFLIYIFFFISENI